MLDIELLKDWAEAHQKKRQLQATLDQVSKQMTQYETMVVDGMMESGIDSIKLVQPNVTVSVGVRYIPKVLDADALHQYLRENGYEDLVKTTVHHASLGKTVKTWDEEHHEDSSEVPMVESIDEDGVPTGTFVPQAVRDFVVSRTKPTLGMRSNG